MSATSAATKYSKKGAQPVEGEEYAAMRHNDQCEPTPSQRDTSTSPVF